MENIVKKSEIAHFEQFHLFPQCFPGASLFNVLKWVYMKEKVNSGSSTSSNVQQLKGICCNLDFLFLKKSSWEVSRWLWGKKKNQRNIGEKKGDWKQSSRNQWNNFEFKFISLTTTTTTKTTTKYMYRLYLHFSTWKRQMTNFITTTTCIRIWTDIPFLHLQTFY